MQQVILLDGRGGSGSRFLPAVGMEERTARARAKAQAAVEVTAEVGVAMQCYCAAARRVARRLTRMYEAELRGAGMNPAQFELMGQLHARPGVSQAALAEAMDLDQTTLSRNMKVLAGLGWVMVSAGVKDRRVSTYALSEAGMAALQAAMPLWERAREKVEGSLENKEVVWRVLSELRAVAEG